MVRVVLRLEPTLDFGATVLGRDGIEHRAGRELTDDRHLHDEKAKERRCETSAIDGYAHARASVFVREMGWRARLTG